MKIVSVFLMLLVMLTGNDRLEVMEFLKDTPCERGYNVYKDVNCINPKEEFVFNKDDTLSCKDSNKSITMDLVVTKGLNIPVKYIDCVEGGVSLCMHGFKQIDDTCVKIEDDIVFDGTSFVCNNRLLRYTPFNVADDNETMPHLVCMKKLRMVEALLSPGNIDRFNKNTPTMGRVIVSVNKGSNITDINLIGRGEVITLSNKEKGLIALSDILDLKKSDVASYIKTTEALLTITTKVIKERMINNNLEHKVLSNPFALSKVILSTIDNATLHVELGEYNSKTFRLSILHMTTVIVESLKGIPKENQDIVIQYILEEFYYIFKLVHRDSKRIR